MVKRIYTNNKETLFLIKVSHKKGLGYTARYTVYDNGYYPTIIEYDKETGFSKLWAKTIHNTWYRTTAKDALNDAERVVMDLIKYGY